ncbi:MAG: FG-GAP repeat protein [Alphaproteobacteria bacterium]|nr:FG-GAP repeat protein [Alphaproteobacteria bacterium]
MWTLTLLLACKDPGTPESQPACTGCDTVETADTGTPADRWTGLRDDEGFGSSLARSADGAVLVGAPFGAPGRVYILQEDAVEVLLEGSGADGLGLGLAVDSAGAVWAGQPLADSGLGRLLVDGEPVAYGAVQDALGARIAASGSAVAATAGAALLVDGARVALPARAAAVTWFDGVPVAGMVQEEVAVWSEAGALDRAAAHDEAGYALCADDVDEDGLTELVVGAPGAATVYILDALTQAPGEATALEGPGGRFGQAVACAPGALLVGAPMYGEALTGAVWQLDAAALTAGTVGAPTRVGRAGDGLGAAVLFDGAHAWAGAPGQADGPGAVIRLP